MALGLSIFLALASAAPQAASPSREQAIATLELQGKAKEALYDCFFNENAEASRALVDQTDPYFFLDQQNEVASKFSSFVSSETLFAKCAVAMAQALPNETEAVATFDLREYRNWAARRIYVQRFPAAVGFGKLSKPKRKVGNYGENKAAVSALLKTIDCAVQRDPANADWLVRNSSPISLQLGGEFLTNSNKLVNAYYKCADRFTPDNGITEMLNSLAGVLADSLLRMTSDESSPISL